jgi:hypothetical protein
MDIVSQVIPHEDQRYPTIGDWQWWPTPEALRIRVSALGDWRYEALIAIHEIVEAVLCKGADIGEEAVTAFDNEHEALDGKGEPGDSPDAPYQRQHGIASGIERMIAAELGVDWVKYEEAVDAL